MTLQTGSILLVEDNIDDIDLTLMAFKRNNIENQVIVAKSGEQALEILHGDGSEKAPLPSVVLMDINMPGMSGIEALKHIRSHPRTRALPVVILTSSKEDQDIIEGYGNGANSYIRKPVNFNEFVNAVKQLGMYWLLLNEPLP
ncbi:MAG TPA: two-component system response regulator [Bacteroidetes bacterium]|nr:two-component system response regulator [Bacteroidota bacterium]